MGVDIKSAYMQFLFLRGSVALCFMSSVRPSVCDVVFAECTTKSPPRGKQIRPVSANRLLYISPNISYKIDLHIVPLFHMFLDTVKSEVFMCMYFAVLSVPRSRDICGTGWRIFTKLLLYNSASWNNDESTGLWDQKIKGQCLGGRGL